MNIPAARKKATKTTNPQRSTKSYQNIQKDVINPIRTAFPRSSGKESCVINYMVQKIIFYGDTFNSMFLESIETIARNCQCSSRTVDKALAKMRSLRMVKRQRRFNSSSIYKLADWLRDVSVIDSLADILPGLRNLLCVSILFPFAMWYQPAANAANQKKCVLYKILNKEFIKKRDQDQKNGHDYDTFKNKFLNEEGECDKKQEQTTKTLQRETINHRNEAIKLKNGVGLKSLAELLGLKPRSVSESVHVLDDMPIISAPKYDYDKSKADYLQFYNERLPRLKTDLAPLSLSDQQKHDVIYKQICAYSKNLHPDDIKQLAAEGYIL